MPNYILLERIELNASAASVTFSSIPQSGYTDLKLVHSSRVSRAAYHDSILLSFNGLTTNRSQRRIYGTGSSVASTADTLMYGGQAPGSTATANTFGSSEIYIPNYTSSNFKSSSEEGVSENNATNAQADMNANLWSSTAAITSITLTPESGGTFNQFSTFSLYGRAAVGTTPVIAPKASGGNNITTDGTYWYHTFTATGAFVPQTGLSCDLLVIGAGAGGAKTGGGGSGVLTYSAANSLTATSYTVTVGAGGSGGTTSTAAGVDGTSSSVNSVTGTGGTGGRGIGMGTDPAAGGSGGGNSGGAGGANGPYQGGGGGGGAGSAGTAGTYSGSGGYNPGGAGGTGVNTYSSWATATSTGVSGYYASGGGGGGGYRNSGTPVAAGGTASSGGGGAGGSGGGSTATNGTNGTANTGGGGGGGGVAAVTDGNGGTGGSGIVIIRYPIA
jgi:hypothetical protein